MITFEEATIIVNNHLISKGSEIVLLSEAGSRVMAEPVKADRDTPPFNKSAVDGYACRASDLGEKLLLLENIAAGYEPKVTISKGTCSKIMTGAMLPAGADTVVMVEDCEFDGKYVSFRGKGPKDNICLRGEDIREGEEVIPSGTLLRPQHIAVLAAFGVAKVKVAERINIGILSTGDEIIEPEMSPSAVQIRNSNGWQLYAQALNAGAKANYLGIARDTKESLYSTLSNAVKQNDAIIITGGVSMGDFDYVPGILEEMGFKILFNKVAVQPGKPSTFAVRKASDGSCEKVIFALPGNPVSCFIQFELLVRPWIIASCGGKSRGLWTELAAGAEYSRRNTGRLAFIPVIISPNGTFTPVRYNGSAHIAALTDANGIAAVPIGKATIAEGEKTSIFILP